MQRAGALLPAEAFRVMDYLFSVRISIANLIKESEILIRVRILVLHPPLKWHLQCGLSSQMRPCEEMQGRALILDGMNGKAIYSTNALTYIFRFQSVRLKRNRNTEGFPPNYYAMPF